MTLRVNDSGRVGCGVYDYKSLVPGHLYRGKNNDTIYLVVNSVTGDAMCVSLRVGEMYRAQDVAQGGLLPVSGVLDIKTGCCCDV